ncbi:MAG: ROK family transcriptional regulator [Rikenellaceae bacterium]
MQINTTSLFDNKLLDNTSGVQYKSYLQKRKIIFQLAARGISTISELAAILNLSNPTITKLLMELSQEGYVRDMGKIETAGGRRPSCFGLISNSGYFLGVDISHDHLNFQIIDLSKNQIALEMGVPVEIRNDYTTLEKIISEIERFINDNEIKKEKILGIGIILGGRVDSLSGHSYNIFNFDPRPLSQLVEIKIGIPTIIENDTRAMAYAEWNCEKTENPQNALFVNVARGVGVGIIINGELYYGKSGFSGEFGHIPFFDNQMICHCGKKGCLETEASGAALERNFVSALNSGASSILSDKYQQTGTVALPDIIDAACSDDVLSIELITSVGEKVGRGIGVLLNLFNPELLVVGGVLSTVGDYLMLPIRTSLNKFSLSLVNRDSQLRLSRLGETAGVIGAALLARKRILEIDEVSN